MRIAVCGPNRAGAISKAENVLHTTAVKPWNVDEKTKIVDYAAETYGHFDQHDVIFDGCAFDYLTSQENGYEDVYEQIALGTLMNLDYIIVITRDMDRNLVKSYNEYAKIYPDKFLIYSSEEEFEIVSK